MDAVKEKLQLVGVRAEIGGRWLAVVKPDGNGQKEQEKASGSPHNGEPPQAGRLTACQTRRQNKWRLFKLFCESLPPPAPPSSTHCHQTTQILVPTEGTWKGGATEEGQSHNGMPLDLNVQTSFLWFSFSQSSTERNSSILKFPDLIYRSERWFAAFFFVVQFSLISSYLPVVWLSIL